MKLFEYEGKQLFKAYDIPVANGWLAANYPNDLNKPVIAKAQVLTGGRGKQGGIIAVNDIKSLASALKTIYEKTFNGEMATDIYIEEQIDFTKEFYLSIIIDRNLKSPLLIVSYEGGVNIEEVPHDKLLKIPINPLLGLQSYMINKISTLLMIAPEKVEGIVSNLWNLFKMEQASLVEINPLFLTKDGDLIAGDAKIIVDEAADTPTNVNLLPRKVNSFEQNISNLGAVGVEMDGDISIVTSGAGLGLATLDLVRSKDGTARALIDLGGHVIHDVNLARELIVELKKLGSKKFYFNFYFQVAECSTLAEAIAKELGGTHYPVVVRLKGKKEKIARQLLSEYSNVYVTDSLEDACISISKGVCENGHYC
ncbi:ATP-grasp domain-containing protein [Pseudalkalibacillus decolorationis]|uniref:ATP-grasp domain-containing protein n=1 Tax=Pseudalkalibacillus decolorationis TaxID=163879 RepID=UPI00214793B4|nr:ATP-grasp domain-containing protein [Pseudalkalibacillus decolorationis]